jgi:hypothetical protein
MFRGIHRESFPHGKNQCPKGENFQLSANFTQIHPQAMGEAAGLHPGLCPHHGMGDWLVLQNFYKGLTPMSKGHIDVAAGGAFLSLTIDGAKALIEKMVTNQNWEEERKQQKDMHSVKEADMLAAKIDLLMKRLDDCTAEKETMKSTVQAMDSHDV